MHRTTLVPHALVLSLVFGWMLSSSPAHAQAPIPGVKQMVVQVGVTQTIETASKLPVAEIRETNPKVARGIPGPVPNLVLITGLVPGTSTITVTDVKKNIEVFEIIVSSNEALALEAARKAFMASAKIAFPTANIDVRPQPNNTVLLTGTVAQAEDVPPLISLARSYFGIATNVINSMRIGGVQMVQIQVVVARVNRSEARNMSFSFLTTYTDLPNGFTIASILRPSSLTNGATLASATAAAATQFAATGGNIPLAFVTNEITGTGFLEALRTEGLAKINAEPTVTTLSGKPAYIVSGGQTPILTSSGQGSPSVSYQRFGTVVEVLPIVMGDGKIYMEVRPEVSQLDAANSLFIAGVTPTAVPGFAIRSVQSAIILEDGQTLAIGGLMQSTQDTTMAKVPLLGDLPYIGALFRNTSSREVEEELLILVTPRLVHPMDCTQLPKYLPGRETRTPDDFELFLEGILEAPRGPRDIGLLGPAAHVDGPTAGVYPCGDNCVHGRRTAGGRLGGLGCEKCQSVIHTAAPVAMPVQTVGNARITVERVLPPATEPEPSLPVLPVAEAMPALSQPEIRELPPVVTPVTAPVISNPVVPAVPVTAVPPPSTSGWQPPPPGSFVPPVSELRRDLN